jgi:hypothetical protein
MLKTITAGLLALLAWSMTPAHAADISFNRECKNGTINEVRCGFIYINGEIKDGDGKKFLDVAASAIGKTDYLYLTSPGGSFEDGMEIAKYVHQHNFRTGVVADHICTSMCAIIWLAGNQRTYGGKTRIGFHSMSTIPMDRQGNRIKNGKRTPYNAGNALVGAFFNQLGLNYEAIAALTDADPTSMFYLNTKRINELGIIAERDRD